MTDAKKIKERFARDGFVVIEQLWTREVIDEVEHEFERFVRDVVPRMRREHKVYIKGWDGPLKSLGPMDPYDAYFKALPLRGDLREIASTLLGHEALACGVEFFNRPPGSVAVAPFHQDNAYFCYTPAEALAFWIPFDHVTQANGGVIYAAGSHHAGLLPHRASGIHGFSQGLVDPDTQLAAHEEVKVEIPRGGCVIHHVLTAHRSGPNPTDAQRRAMVLNYKTPRAVEDPQIKEHMKRELENLLKSVGAKD